MLIRYKIQNTFQSVTGQTFTVSGGTGPITIGGFEGINKYKSIIIPIDTKFFPVDSSEDLQSIVINERRKVINPTFDAETTKYKFMDDNDPTVNSGNGLLIQFKFWNTTSSTYTTDYIANDFTALDINKKRNGFKKSFFRLYFYDTNSGDTSNLIFTEDLSVNTTTQPIIKFNRLYWLRNDNYFVDNNNNRMIYMDARFFNAKTGKVTRFINSNVIGAPNYITSPLTITQYSNQTNRDWRTSAIELINPKLNNGEYNFRPLPNWGANTPTIITLSEFIMV